MTMPSPHADALARSGVPSVMYAAVHSMAMLVTILVARIAPDVKR